MRDFVWRKFRRGCFSRAQAAAWSPGPPKPNFTERSSEAIVFFLKEKAYNYEQLRRGAAPARSSNPELSIPNFWKKKRNLNLQFENYNFWFEKIIFLFFFYFFLSSQFQPGTQDPELFLQGSESSITFRLSFELCGPSEGEKTSHELVGLVQQLMTTMTTFHLQMERPSEWKTIKVCLWNECIHTNPQKFIFYLYPPTQFGSEPPGQLHNFPPA